MKNNERKDTPSSSLIPKTLLDCIITLEKDNSQFSWKLTRKLKEFPLVVISVGAIHVTPLTDGQTASETGRQAKSTDDSPLKRPKRKGKKKFPSTVARDRARRQRFWKQKKSANSSHLNTRQQQTEENTVLEADSIHTGQECSSAVCEVAKDRPSRLDTDLEEYICDLDELIA